MFRFTLVFSLITSPIILSAGQTGTPPSVAASQPQTQQSNTAHLPHLRRLIGEGNWTELANQVKIGVEKHELSLHDLQMSALSFPGTPFFFAVLATKNILTHREKTGLSLADLFPIALFAETSMRKEVENGKLFWSEKQFGRELQYDKEHNRFFIHLGTHGVKPVGIGRMKVVTKTVLYDRSSPEVMARGVSKAACKREMFAMKALAGTPNVMEAQALMRHKDPKTGKMLATIVTKIIRPGSLQAILNKKSWRLTLKERVKIACDIMNGISKMQAKGFVHCDLGAKNYFVSIKGTKPGHRKIVAYVADFGRAIPISDAKDSPVQGNSRYAPPEAIFREKMRGKQYFKSDLYAVGCVFWQLYFGRLPPWAFSAREEGTSVSRKQRYRAKVFHINAIRAHYADRVKTDPKEKHAKPSLRKGFLSVILKMTDPTPKERGKAKELYINLYTLLTGHPPADSAEGSATATDGKKPNTGGGKKK